jgi:hypothetical protein
MLTLGDFVYPIEALFGVLAQASSKNGYSSTTGKLVLLTINFISFIAIIMSSIIHMKYVDI